MQIHLIATIMKTKWIDKIVGYRLYDIDANIIKDVTVQQLTDVLNKGAVIENIGLDEKGLAGSNGSLSRYTSLDSLTKQPIKEPTSAVVLKQIDTTGYLIVDFKGTTATICTEELVSAIHAGRINIANGKVVSKQQGTEFISSINGTYHLVSAESIGGSYYEQVKAEQDEKCKQYLENDDGKEPAPEKDGVGVDMTGTEPSAAPGKINLTPEIVDTVNQHKAPVIKLPKDEYNPLNDTLKSDAGSNINGITGQLTVSEKLVAALKLMRNYTPFYFCIIASVPKYSVTHIETMGVTLTALIYNPNFVNKIPMDELVFVLMHEAAHILMRHNYRVSSRDMYIFNVVTDLFINKMISVDYGCTKASNWRSTKNKVSMPRRPDWGLYAEAVNCDNDTPEVMYDLVIKEAKKQAKQQQGSQGQGQGQGQGQQGQGQQGPGQGQQGQGPGQGQQGQGPGQGQQGQSQQGNGQGQGQQGQGSQQGNGQGQGQQGQGSGQGGQGQSGQGSGQGQQSGEYSDADIRNAVKKLYNVDISDRITNDIFQDADLAGMSDAEAAQKIRSILEKAAAIRRQLPGYTFDKSTASGIELMLDEILAPKIRWQSVFKHKLNKTIKREESYSRPNRRYIHSNTYMPGEKPRSPDSVGNVAIAIDTSGSISTEDLSIALKQISEMIKQYNASGTLMYWGTSVVCQAPFENIEQALKLKPRDGGGTDPNCIFQEFEKSEYKRGRKKVPGVIIIFTDGFFGDIDEKYIKKYNRAVIWVISSCGGSFKAQLGAVAPLKLT